ncbi:MAG: hypothetical protein FWE69_00815, partial [Clostridiales bacterium]|nr:hypothetical protein [Clostridiales bacterium]
MRKKYYSRVRRLGNRKIIALAAAIVLCVVALLGGMYAWTDFTQSFTNRFRGNFDADVTLHDEFDGLRKDVFVENSGVNTIYVRVRLDEYMQVGDKIFATGADAKNKYTWSPHTYNYDGPSVTDCGRADIGKFHEYYEWNMVGSARRYNPGTPGMVYTKLTGVDPITGEPMVDRSDGTHTTADAVKPILMSDFVLVQGKINVAGVTEYTDIQALLSSSELAIYDAYAKGCWVLDNTDTAANGGGWAYWSLPLASGKATNCLLDTVTLIKDADDSWIYRIDVKLQAVSLGDVGKWNFGDWKTTSAAEVLIGT